jgi:regulator of PEP synthase PpsR (kinase-PPPase family)
LSQEAIKRAMSRAGEDNTFYLLSDGTGETAEVIINAAVAQFRKDNVNVERMGHILAASQVSGILDHAEKRHSLLFYTFVNRELAKFTEDECAKRGIECLDLMSPILRKLTTFFGHSPEGTPGILHGVGEEYFQRMEAMEFALKNDDGRSLTHLGEADIILVGVSRTSKTPLSVYLSVRGYKVANIPLVKGITIPAALLKADPKKVAGLFLDVKQLVERREVRVETLGVSPRTDYIDYEAVQNEIRWARSLCRDNGWAVVHVTGKSVEETAHEVLVKLNKK